MKKILFVILSLCIIIVVVLQIQHVIKEKRANNVGMVSSDGAIHVFSQQISNAATVSTPFVNNIVIEETGGSDIPQDRFFWLNSGGRVTIQNSIASTIQGDLPTSDRWYIEYNKSNPLDTDGGLHPQNLLRLISLSDWTNNSQELYFNLKKYNKSSSPNRNASNGVLFFSRLKDSNNLYYAGIRVDGTVVIKKKKEGSYHTLAQKKILPGTYDVNTNYNLLPLNTWLGMKLVTETKNGAVVLSFYVDLGQGLGFEKMLETVDNGSQGGTPFFDKGKGGIRGDFFDFIMRDYIIADIEAPVVNPVPTATSTATSTATTTPVIVNPTTTPPVVNATPTPVTDTKNKGKKGRGR